MKSRSYSRIFLFSFLFLVHEKANAQTPGWQWANAIGGAGGDFVYSIVPDPAGNGDVYTTGHFTGTVDFDPGAGTFNLTSVGGRDVFISKLDGAGNLIWAKAVGGPGEDYVRSIAVDPAGSGDVYAIGYFSATADFDPGPVTFNLTSIGLADFYMLKLVKYFVSFFGYVFADKQ